MTQVLIDADLVAYRCAASCEKQGVVTESLEVALARAEELMHRIIFETGATSYRAFLSTGKTFRNDLYPEYKANRKDMKRPDFLQDVREYLITNWKAELAIGIEADDLLGIHQTETTIIASLDKDMLQVEGKHYNWVKQEMYDISPLSGRRHYYFQLVMGDRADNVPGYDGKMRNVVPKFLESKIQALEACETDEEMDALVREMYTDETQYEINKKIFYILREPLEERGPVDRS